MNTLYNLTDMAILDYRKTIHELLLPVSLLDDYIKNR